MKLKCFKETPTYQTIQIQTKKILMADEKPKSHVGKFYTRQSIQM